MVRGYQAKVYICDNKKYLTKISNESFNFIMKKKIVKAALFLIIAAALFSCKEKPSREIEPNDSFSTANKIELNKPMEGFFNNSHDRDFYSIEILSDSILDISLSEVKGINHAFQIWRKDSPPFLMKTIDDNRKSSPERMANFFVSPGTYYITVLHGDRDPQRENLENPYTLKIIKRDFSNEEMEPNDTKEKANLLTPGNEIKGYFSPALNREKKDKEFMYREEDWFVLEKKSDSSKKEILNISLSGVSGVNSVLYLYDAEGNEIASADENGAGTGESILGVGLTDEGRYYILVTTVGYSFNHDEPYTLKASYQEYDPLYEVEPNDSFDSANDISNGEIKGRINNKKDRDIYYYKSSKSPWIYRVELTPSAKSDLKYTIFNSDKKKIVEVNNAGTGEKEVHPNFYSTGNFYVAVESKNIPENISETEYSLTVKPFEDIKNQEIEPNDSKNEATRITSEEIRGYISKKGDKDYFLLEYNARAKNHYEITGVKGGEIKVSVTDPLGYIIKSVNVRTDNRVKISEIIDKKGYIIIESVVENYDSGYIIRFGR
jgi:hypothetical protein